VQGLHAKDDLGNQYAKWQTTKHAQAFTTLTTPEAKAAGAKVGVADPSTDHKCLICHTTGPGVKPEEGVSCEACHGPGADWKSKEVHGTDRKAALAAGMIDTKAQGEASARSARAGARRQQEPKLQAVRVRGFKEKIAHPLPKK